jgi:hypothetical protein
MRSDSLQIYTRGFHLLFPLPSSACVHHHHHHHPSPPPHHHHTHTHPAVLKHVKVKRINLKGVRSQCDQWRSVVPHRHGWYRLTSNYVAVRCRCINWPRALGDEAHSPACNNGHEDSEGPCLGSRECSVFGASASVPGTTPG